MKSRAPRLTLRLYCLAIAFVLAFGGVAGKAFYLQVTKRDELRSMSQKHSQTVLILPSLRGDIYDSHLEKLATSVSSDTLSVHGAIMKKPGEIFLALSQVLDMDYESLAQKLEKAVRYAVVKRDLSESESAAVAALDMEGVTIEKGYRRVYPNGSLASHLLGFVGVEGQGLEGLELALNDSLLAPAKRVRVTRDNKGRVIMDSAAQVQEVPRGASVMLTLDRRIQFIAEKAIARAVVASNAKSGMAIAVRPRTGEIVASAVYPTYDPNDYGAVPMETRRNRILTDPFEPGSTFKVFTVAAGLEEGLIAPDTVLFCENGLYKIDGGTPIRDTGSYGDLTVSRIVQVSSNIGAAKIGERLGPQKLHNYLTRFSFGEKSGLAYPSGESAGRLRPAKDWRRLDAANVAFGQGLSVTALQLVMAVAALGNDGYLMRPMLVSRVIDADGRVIESREPEIIRQVVSRLTARQVLAMMRMAVMKGGTGTRGDIPEYPIAAKTGTSQKFDADEGSYSHFQFVASYVGLAPYHNPELCLYVVLDEPWPDYYGGSVAAPVFREIMSEALPLLDIPPKDETETAPPAWPTPDSAKGGVPGVLPDYANANYLRVSIPKGDKGAQGPIAPADAPWGGEELGEAAALPLEADPGDPAAMPDLTGLSMRQVLDRLSPLALNLECRGSGRVIAQEPAAGTLTRPGSEALVSFGGKDA
ncbi:MAG: transpeptidase family protein [Deltaproteobacteria bacterium]|jgi:cell division protein FtsI (penicillin-binding protein 3)|nr:transpeptidase family protein [Deltaproteobacteria bacterium]